MRCNSCGAWIDPHVFPDATVRCSRCGEAHLSAGTRPPSSSPYREPAAPSTTPSPDPLGDSDAPWTAGLLCPRCGRALSSSYASGEWRCDGCHGAFVEELDLAARIAAERPSPPPAVRPRHARSGSHESAVRYGRCPKCAAVMTRTNLGGHSGILVDVCARHGTWFDAGELEATLEFVRMGGLGWGV